MRKLLLVITLLLAHGSLAFAQGGHMGTPQEQKSCSRDASRFCRKELGDDGAVQRCLQQNRTKLSSACKKVFQTHGM
jgi:cysteine rich repeat protein